MDDMILLKLGEMVLKGLNRRSFEQRLMTVIKRTLRPAGEFRAYTLQSAMYVEPIGQCNMDMAYELLQKVFGIVAISRAAVCAKEKNAILETAINYLSNQLNSASTFKVESKRSDKTFPMTSIQLSQYVGGELHDRFPNLSPDMHHPELTVYVEVRDRAAYVHADGKPGAGGLPIGTSGRAISLLSGGIDSPVSTWMMARRGLSIIPVHFFSPPYTSELAKEKVVDLARLLSPWCGGFTLDVVPFAHIQEEIRSMCPEEYFTLIMRRFMMRIAQRLADDYQCGGIVTGENLGQVASQTMEALLVTENCARVPVLRPLIGMDKKEIVAYAEKLGTFETSIQPYEDCCTVFTPRHPRTKPKLEDVESCESVLDVDGLVEEAVMNIERIRI